MTLTLKTAQKILEQGTKYFNEIEVIVSDDQMTEMQIDAGQISLMRTTQEVSATIKVLKEGRYASRSLNQLESKNIEDVFLELNQSIKDSPVDPARVFVPKHEAPKSDQIGSLPSNPDFQNQLMFEKLSEFLREQKNQFPKIKLEQSAVKKLFNTQTRLNVHGYSFTQTQDLYQFVAMFSALEGQKRSSFNYSGGMAQDIKTPLMHWGAVQRLLKSSELELEAKPLGQKFKGPLLLTPESAYDLLSFVMGHLGDGPLIAGTSHFAQKMGQKALSSLLTLKTVTQRPGLATPEWTTPEGYQSQDAVIIQNGVIESWLLSEFGARKTGLVRGKNSGQNWVIQPGNTSLEQMLKSTKKGLWLGRLSGGHPASNGDFSGVAKSSYLIQDGKLGQPVSEVMISGNLFELFNQILMISSEVQENGETLLPYFLVDGATISG